MSGRRESRPHRCRAAGGFSYVEVLVAAAVIVFALSPAMESLSVAMSGSAIHEDAVADFYHVRGLLEDVLARPFDEVDAEAAMLTPTAPSSYSDAAGSNRRRLVYLSRFDGDGADADGDTFTGTDAGLLWVSVALEGSLLRLTTLRER